MNITALSNAKVLIRTYEPYCTLANLISILAKLHDNGVDASQTGNRGTSSTTCYVVLMESDIHIKQQF